MYRVAMTPDNRADDVLAEIREGGNRGLALTLGIEMIELDTERVVATMPVDERTRQPFGILHGGASVALAETVASVASLLNIDREKYVAMGLEINANHVRAKSDGIVTAIGTPLHRGRTTQLWEIRIQDEEGRLICMSRCTIAVVPLEKARKS